MSSKIENFFIYIVQGLESALFYPLFKIENVFDGIPFLILWLACAGIFFAFKLGFANIKLFTHGFKVAMGKYYHKSDIGVVMPRQAAFATISGTVGLGNIAGVAVAISIGGPGAVIWMMIAAFFGMSTIFAEVIAGQKYRKIDENGNVFGGPFRYLQHGLADVGMKRLGLTLSVIFAIFASFGAIGASMFQTNQATAAITHNFTIFHNMDVLVALAIAILAAFVLIGGIKRIVHIADIIVPIMAGIYIISCFIIIFFNIDKLPSAFILMYKSAFGIDSVAGGMIGAILAGVQRAAFSNEAGLGTTPIAHSAAKSKYPARQASVAALTPFIDTIIICFLTGIVITTTGAYNLSDSDGVNMTLFAFGTVSKWFPTILTIAVILFAYSTVITYGYYGEKAWAHLFGKKTVNFYYGFYCLALFLAGGVVDFKTVIRITDAFVLSMAIPNLIGLYLISSVVKKESNSYLQYVKKLKVK